ncbi:MAG: recombination protein O N-terminal domain-containing protein [Muribaculaceae bacterium]|nr:recombination protein O N-terminal domain-containing protein [Muribaculaceae bacterium]
MTEKITGIILDITRHSDRLSIVTLFTRTRGRISFLSPAGTGKAGRLRQARLQPLAVIEADINFKTTSELQRLGNFSLHEIWNEIYFDPMKRLVALFLADFLNRLLRASMPDELMWDYIRDSLRLLDRMTTGVADFHIAFLSSLLTFAGIQPDGRDYRQGCVFDMQAGVFTSRVPSHSDYLYGEEARFAALLSRINFTNVRALRLNGRLRSEILDKLLRYYAIHFPGASNLRSLDVIHDILS